MEQPTEIDKILEKHFGKPSVYFQIAVLENGIFINKILRVKKDGTLYKMITEKCGGGLPSFIELLP